MRHEDRNRLLRQNRLGRVAERVDDANLIQEDIKVLRRKAGQPYHRTGVVDKTIRGERVFGKPRLKGGVAIEPSLCIEQKLGGTPKNEPQSFCRALERIVENPQNVLDIGTGTGIWAIDFGMSSQAGCYVGNC